MQPVILAPMRHLWFVLVLGLGGCGDNSSANSDSNSASASSTGTCTVGFEGCPCTDEGVCLAGLACVDQRCVGGDSATEGVPTGSASESASAGSAGTVTASTTQDSTGSATQTSGSQTSGGTTGQTTTVSASDSDPSMGTTVAVSDSTGTSGSSGAAASSSEGGSTGGMGVCGDGVADDGEACDGADLGGKTCSALGFQYGQLQCTPACAHDTAKCTNSAACGDGIIVQNVLCYKPITEYLKYYHFSSLGLGDLNEDGHLDFIGASNLYGMKFWPGVGDGTFEINKQLILDTLKLVPAHILDLDKDGHLDLIGFQYDLANKIQIARGDGTGNLTAHVSYDTILGSFMDFADVNGDGWLDMAICGVGNSKFVGFRRGEANAMFGPLVTYPIDPTFGAYTCGFIDFDRDGDLDLWSVVGALGGSEFRILYGDGAGKFLLDPTKIKFPGGEWAYMGHLDGDDYVDIVGFPDKAGNGELNVRHGTVTWLEDMLYAFLIEGLQQGRGYTGNFDGNDILDVMVRSQTTIQLEVFRGDGDGLFYDGVTLVGDHVVSEAAVGDINEDGLDDIATIRTHNQGSAFAKVELILSDP